MIERSLVLWVVLMGALSFELFGHLEGVVSHRGAWFDAAMAVAAEGVGLPVPLPAARRTPVRALSWVPSNDRRQCLGTDAGRRSSTPEADEARGGQRRRGRRIPGSHVLARDGERLRRRPADPQPAV